MAQLRRTWAYKGTMFINTRDGSPVECQYSNECKGIGALYHWATRAGSD